MSKKRVLGIDYGMARIGIALSDPTQIIASPLTMVPNKGGIKKVVDQVTELITQHDPECVVIGMPYQLSGKKGFSADEVELFVKELQKKTSCPIHTHDERLTTQQTERAMKSGQMNRKKRTKVIDSACAALILQSFLDQKNITQRPSYDELLAYEM